MEATRVGSVGVLVEAEVAAASMGAGEMATERWVAKMAVVEAVRPAMAPTVVGWMVVEAKREVMAGLSMPHSRHNQQRMHT